jgi:hypothetical protein
MRLPQIYPKFGGDLRYACQRLAEGLDASGVVIVLYRGEREEAEIGMTFGPGLEIDAAGFCALADDLLENAYSASLSAADRACVMLAEATDAKCAILFIINKEGGIRVSVSAPQSGEFVSASALYIADALAARN